MIARAAAGALVGLAMGALFIVLLEAVAKRLA